MATTFRRMACSPRAQTIARNSFTKQPTRLLSTQQRSFASASPNWSDEDDSSTPYSFTKLFNPTEDHAALRQMVRTFTEREVEPQALEYNRSETFNIPLFRKFGSENGGLGILGLTVPEEFGGTGLVDATAVSIVHEELSYSGKLCSQSHYLYVYRMYCLNIKLFHLPFTRSNSL